MPNSCSVPGCRSNYDGGVSTPCFQLPKNEELRREWIRALHREGIEKLASVFVDEKHFCSYDLIVDNHDRLLHIRRQIGKETPKTCTQAERYSYHFQELPVLLSASESTRNCQALRF